ncbi:MAG: hypothetical protein LC777_03195 [Actinobacteria bacterium]|nr:hypothetical protein [Actinomycetota bacterium]
MAEQTNTQGGWIARWREHRRAKRQQELEGRYYNHERARSAGIPSTAEDFTAAKAYARAYPSNAAGPWGGMLRDVGGQNPCDGRKS